MTKQPSQEGGGGGVGGGGVNWFLKTFCTTTTKPELVSGLAQPCLRPLFLNLQPVRVPLVTSSNPKLLSLHWIVSLISTSSRYTHSKFQAPMPSLFTLGFWLQWALHNSFKLYTLEALSLKHNETLSLKLLRYFKYNSRFDEHKDALYNMHM